jgi:hypothetical protein
MFIFLYSRHFDKDAGNGCEEDCLRQRLCSTATSKVGDNTHCNILLQELDDQINGQQVAS